MKVCILTLFPELFTPFWDHGIIRRAIQAEKLDPVTINIRDHAEGRHRVTDDRPYGGGCGMVMKPEPLTAALMEAKTRMPQATVLLLSPQGRPFDQTLAESLAATEAMVMVCGRYEGVDERFIDRHVDAEISIGDFVLTGGELGAMVITDAVTRLIPGVLGNEDSAQSDTFSDGLVEYAHYTRPPVFDDQDVPDVLLSGNHQKIDRWRRENALIRTVLKRPDLLEQRALTAEERRNPRENGAGSLTGYSNNPLYVAPWFTTRWSIKTAQMIASAVTNLDLHDIARACRTYGVNGYYVITPLEDQQVLVAADSQPLVDRGKGGRTTPKGARRLIWSGSRPHSVRCSATSRRSMDVRPKP